MNPIPERNGVTADRKAECHCEMMLNQHLADTPQNPAFGKTLDSKSHLEDVGEAK